MKSSREGLAETARPYNDPLPAKGVFSTEAMWRNPWDETPNAVAHCAFNSAHWRAIEHVAEAVAESRSISAVIAPPLAGAGAVAAAAMSAVSDPCIAAKIAVERGDAAALSGAIANALGVGLAEADISVELDLVRQRLEQLSSFDAAMFLFIENAAVLDGDAFAIIERLAAHGRRLERMRALEQKQGDAPPLGAKFVLFGDEALAVRLISARDAAQRAAGADAVSLRFFNRDEIRAFMRTRLRAAAENVDDIDLGAALSVETLAIASIETAGSPELLGMMCAHDLFLDAAKTQNPVKPEAVLQIAAALCFLELREQIDPKSIPIERTAPVTAAALARLTPPPPVLDALETLGLEGPELNADELIAELKSAPTLPIDAVVELEAEPPAQEPTEPVAEAPSASEMGEIAPSTEPRQDSPDAETFTPMVAAEDDTPPLEPSLEPVALEKLDPEEPNLVDEIVEDAPPEFVISEVSAGAKTRDAEPISPGSAIEAAAEDSGAPITSEDASVTAPVAPEEALAPEMETESEASDDTAPSDVDIDEGSFAESDWAMVFEPTELERDDKFDIDDVDPATGAAAEIDPSVSGASLGAWSGVVTGASPRPDSWINRRLNGLRGGQRARRIVIAPRSLGPSGNVADATVARSEPRRHRTVTHGALDQRKVALAASVCALAAVAMISWMLPRSEDLVALETPVLAADPDKALANALSAAIAASQERASGAAAGDIGSELAAEAGSTEVSDSQRPAASGDDAGSIALTKTLSTEDRGAATSRLAGLRLAPPAAPNDEAELLAAPIATLKIVAAPEAELSGADLEIERRMLAALAVSEKRFEAFQYTKPRGKSAYDALLEVYFMRPMDPRLTAAFQRLIGHYEATAAAALKAERFSEYYRLNAIIERIHRRQPL